MEEIPFLTDIVMLMAVSVPLSIVLTRMGLPTIVGFLITGVVLGPHGLGLVTVIEEVETLAQIGIVLLLFTIGIEFSVTRMLRIKKESMLGGGLQISVTALLVTLISIFFNQPVHVSVLLGFIVALSSSAIVLKLLMERGEINSTHGDLSVGILLFQDICVVLMVMVVQSFGERGTASWFEVLTGFVEAVIIIFIIVTAVAYIMPRLFYEVVKLRNREVFVLTIVLACLGTAWLTSLAGLSLAIGAFIAGLVISESEYSHQIVAEVIPFRDTFSSLFFISIGMLLDIDYFVSHMGLILFLTVAVMCLKTLILTGVGMLFRYPLRMSIMIGLNLSQIGEFSFILIGMGVEYDFLGEGLYQSLLSVSIITMALTPFIFRWSSYLAHGLGQYMERGMVDKGPPVKRAPSNHVIIVGYGLNGRNLARVLKETGIEHLVMDVNGERVRTARTEGHQAIFGDASYPEILRRAGIERAKMLVVAISDPISARRIVKTARDLNPALSILVRTRYVREVEDLYRLGANQVIPEEFETSVEIFARVLRDYRVPGNIIQNQIDLVREEGYAMLRTPAVDRERLSRLTTVLETSITDTFYVDRRCGIVGKTIAELDLRRKTGTTILAVIRKGAARTNPPADLVIESGDILVLLGNHAELNSAFKMLKDKCPT